MHIPNSTTVCSTFCIGPVGRISRPWGSRFAATAEPPAGSVLPLDIVVHEAPATSATVGGSTMASIRS